MRNPEPAESHAQAAQAFSTQAPVFDKTYGADPMIAYKRQRVRDHVMEVLPASASILELNAGTGEDALFFARQGHTIHATDISEGMQEELKIKVAAAGLTNKITAELISYSDLLQLKKPGPYDLIFSNFAGLIAQATSVVFCIPLLRYKIVAVR